MCVFIHRQTRSDKSMKGFVIRRWPLHQRFSARDSPPNSPLISITAEICVLMKHQIITTFVSSFELFSAISVIKWIIYSIGTFLDVTLPVTGLLRVMKWPEAVLPAAAKSIVAWFADEIPPSIPHWFQQNLVVFRILWAISNNRTTGVERHLVMHGSLSGDEKNSFIHMHTFTAIHTHTNTLLRFNSFLK